MRKGFWKGFLDLRYDVHEKITGLYVCEKDKIINSTGITNDLQFAKSVATADFPISIQKKKLFLN